LANLGFIDDLDQKHGVLNWIFQQNGAPSHTAQETIDWVEENCNLFARSPANLPDLNPVEFLWAILKMIVANLRPETLDELK
jgi:transposase